MEDWWRGEPSLAVAGSSLRIAAVKRALFYLFIVVLLRDGEGQGVCLLSNFVTVCELDQCMKYTISVHNATDIISLSPTCTFFALPISATVVTLPPVTMVTSSL